MRRCRGPRPPPPVPSGPAPPPPRRRVQPVAAPPAPPLPRPARAGPWANLRVGPGATHPARPGAGRRARTWQERLPGRWPPADLLPVEQPEPSLAKVLGTTVRLWLERRSAGARRLAIVTAVL